jgi:hypothetical protein
MQENQRKAQRILKIGMLLLAAYFIVGGALSLLYNFHVEEGPWYPVRAQTCSMEELPDHKFNLRFQFDYQKNGNWYTFEQVSPVKTYGWAKFSTQREPAGELEVRFDPDQPGSFHYRDSQSTELEGDRQLVLSFGFFIVAWMLLAVRKLSPQKGAVTLFFLVSLLLGWLGVRMIVDESRQFSRVNGWETVEAEVDFYESVPFLQTNTRYRYRYQNQDYAQGWVSVDGKVEPVFPLRQVAWMILSGEKKITCFENPENPDEACLAKFNEFSILCALLFTSLALGLLRLVFLIVGTGSVKFNPFSKRRVYFWKGLGYVFALYLLSWVPSMLVFLKTSSSLTAGVLCPLASLSVGAMFTWFCFRVGRGLDRLNSLVTDS